MRVIYAVRVSILAKWPYRGWGIREIGIYLLCWGTLVPDDDLGKMTIYLVFIGCTGVLWYLMMILGK